MAREKRRVSPSGMYHVLLRGVNELFTEDKDFEEFKVILNKYFENFDGRLLGYALMTNRIHLVVDCADGSLSAVMKPLCTSYARYYNRVYDIQGKLFYDRYKSEPIADKTELGEVMSFLAALPAEYKEMNAHAEGSVSLSCIDDYCRMTDEELTEYIEYIFSCNIDALEYEEKKTLAETVIAGKRIGAGRIYKLFGLGRKSADKNPEKETPKKGGNLSVWLL